MEILFAAVSAYDDNHHILTIKADEGETIRVGQKISIMLTDGTYVEHEIASMSKYVCEDKAKPGKNVNIETISDGQCCEADIYGIKGSVQTSDMISPDERKRRASIINLMPYKELFGGEESIYDHVDKNFTVPKKVIAYLKTTQPHCIALGVYKHPFKDKKLYGPYYYTDGEYFWDRDAWKYVVKYHVTLPQKFIDKVMSDEGTAFLEKCAADNKSWAKIIGEWKQQPNTLCLMPDDAGDISLEDF